MGKKGGSADGEGKGKSKLERFKLGAEAVALISLLVTAGLSLKASIEVNNAAKEANAAAKDANAAVREGNEYAAALGALDANASLAATVPRVIINDGGNDDYGDGYARATGYNTSQYPAIVVGAKLDFDYSNIGGDDETSNLALETATTGSCVFEVWSSEDGAASSALFPCTQPVSVGPDDILWVSAGIPEAQKKMFCARYPDGVVGFSIEIQHALYNVSNDSDGTDPHTFNVVCEGRNFADSP